MANIDVFLSKIIPIVLCGAPRDMLSGTGIGDVTIKHNKYFCLSFCRD